MSDLSCQVCDQPGSDACERCRKPTCSAHYFDEEYLGICQPCHDELDAMVKEHGSLTNWPHPVRKVRKEWVDPEGPEVLTGREP